MTRQLTTAAKRATLSRMPEEPMNTPAPTPTSPDALLEEALASTGTADPRPALRELLRGLRDTDEGAYRTLVARFEDEVIRPIRTRELAPLDAWLRFGITLAEARLPVAAIEVGPSGVAAPLDPGAGARPGFVILHVPAGTSGKATLVQGPEDLSPAQQATVDLLVHSKVRSSVTSPTPGA
jgi:hypothetical protein